MTVTQNPPTDTSPQGSTTLSVDIMYATSGGPQSAAPAASGAPPTPYAEAQAKQNAQTPAYGGGIVSADRATGGMQTDQQISQQGAVEAGQASARSEAGFRAGPMVGRPVQQSGSGPEAQKGPGFSLLSGPPLPVDTSRYGAGAVGAVVEIIAKYSARSRGVAKVGTRLSMNELVEAAARGEDVVADSRRIARQIAKALSAPGRTPVLDRAGRHSPLPHYHPVNATGERVEGVGHIFFKERSLMLDILDLFGPLFILPENFDPVEFLFPRPVAQGTPDPRDGRAETVQ